MTSYDPHPVCSTPFISLKRGVRVISEAVRAIYGGHMTISDTHETEAPNLYCKITHTYGVVVRGYEVNIPVIPTFWIGRPLSPPTLKEKRGPKIHLKAFYSAKMTLNVPNGCTGKSFINVIT